MFIRPTKPTLRSACTLPPAHEIVDDSSDEEAGPKSEDSHLGCGKLSPSFAQFNPTLKDVVNMSQLSTNETR